MSVPNVILIAYTNLLREIYLVLVVRSSCQRILQKTLKAINGLNLNLEFS